MYGAFSGCGLTNITIPENVKEIEDHAFLGCPMTSITIPKSVVKIGNCAVGYSVGTVAPTPDFIIYGYAGTAADTYAKENQIKFVKLEDPSGWKREDSAWYYYEDGKPVTGWYQVDGTWYYFNDSGVMQTGWLNDGGTWYYLNASGSMATDWVSVDGTWYYMNGFGAMQTGWLDNGAWYYLNSYGAVAAGWWRVVGRC